MTTALTFGTFDRLDEEHWLFLSEVRKLGDRLIVGVARDAHVRVLKGKQPTQSEERRREAVSCAAGVTDAILCDEQLGSYAIIDAVKPDVIAIGHDQFALAEDLSRWMAAHRRAIPIIRLPKNRTTPDREFTIAVGFVQYGDRMLLLHRRDEKTPAWDNKWELPGGKIGEGETPEEAVRREIREETGLEPLDATFLGRWSYDWHLPEKILRVQMHCFRCRVNNDRVQREERSTYASAWVRPDEALTYDLLQANAQIIRTFSPLLYDSPDMGGN